MGRVTGRQRSTITKQTQPPQLLMPWEVRYQHRIDNFLKSPRDMLNTSQDIASPVLSHRSVDTMLPQKDSELNALDSVVIHKTNSSEDCSGLQVMVQRQDQENSERETCGHSNDSADGKVELPTYVDASVQPAELLNPPARKQERPASGGLASGTLTPLQQSPIQAEDAFNHHVKQSNAVLKTIKYAINYNLDEIFNYTFTGGKVSLKQRLMNE